MKSHKAGLSVAVILLSTPAWAVPQLKDAESISAVIAAMTPEEKAALVTGTGINNAEKVAGAAGSTFAIPRLGIPQIVFADGPVGVRLGRVQQAVKSVSPARFRCPSPWQPRGTRS